VPTPDKRIRLFLASSNEGKLRELRDLAVTAGRPFDIQLIPNFKALPKYEEAAPTFAENAAGKALHYSRWCAGVVAADDSGLVVPALGGAPGVSSARYAGPGASDAGRIRKLLGEMQRKTGDDRRARFVCVIALAEHNRVRGIFSDAAEGELLDAPRGQGGFGYDPVFFIPALGKTYAEITREEKNMHSHRGKAFRKALEFLITSSG
jgi:XTP/dITP diphosphohydrolase